MRKLLFFISTLLTIVFILSCNHHTSKPDKKNTSGGTTVGKHQEGHSDKPLDTTELPSDTLKQNAPKNEYKHYAKDQEVVDSLKRKNQERKKKG